MSKNCLKTVAITHKRTALRSVGSSLYCSLHLCRRDVCSPMLTTVPSTITKIWNQPRSHRCVCGFRKLLTHGEENKGEHSCFSLLLWKETRLGLDSLSYLLRFLAGSQDSWRLVGRQEFVSIEERVLYQKTVNAYVTCYLVAYLQINKRLFFSCENQDDCVWNISLRYIPTTDLHWISTAMLDHTDSMLHRVGTHNKNGIIYFVKPIPNMWERGTELIHQEYQ